MIIMRLCGGLGNQMFQYALGRALALRHKTSLWLDLSFYSVELTGVTPRTYRLNNFRIKERLMLMQDGRMALSLPSKLQNYLANKPHWPGTIIPITEQGLGFNAHVFETKGTLYLDGYWQTEKYFIDIADIIRRDFRLKQPMTPQRQEIQAQMAGRQAVSIHVRRTDYITNPNASVVHGTCSPEWYGAAIERIKGAIASPRFFIFSDDPVWARANLPVPPDSVFVDPQPDGREFEDIHLMAKCNHHIIANSSFSWWGAWLNPSPDKKVIAPAQWFLKESDMRDRLPLSWTLL